MIKKYDKEIEWSANDKNFSYVDIIVFYNEKLAKEVMNFYQNII